MAYSELIKNYEKIRDYMREFYVYGFRTREEYDRKSARSYDNERRRVESWLGDFMTFRRDTAGKSVFLSVDSRVICHNPLYKAFKAKSFTDRDITLHFFILDLLQPGTELSPHEMIEKIQLDYLVQTDVPPEFDDSTLRKKLKEYEALGILKSRRSGREILFSRTEENVNLSSWQEAAAFFSEADPMGVVGSFILDRFNGENDHYHFKHHYILHALDSQILLLLLEGIGKKRSLDITMVKGRSAKEVLHRVCPLRILISTQTGRQYLLCYHYGFRRPMVLRMDNIHRVKMGEIEEQYEMYCRRGDQFQKNLWGVSTGEENTMDHIEMTVRVEPNEYYITDRLEREKRNGQVERIGDGMYRFTADVCDAAEMLPWLRTFIGRVEDLKCSNPDVTERFYGDLKQMQDLYGGEDHGIQ